MNFLKNYFTLLENKISRFKLSIIIIIIGSSFLYLFSVSWLRWGNLISDTFRDLWLPRRILEGRVLYKDLFYYYGFFPPYFLAILYRIFGVHINTLVECGIGITILFSIILYKISRLFLDEIASCLLVLTFLFVFAFGYYNPYSGIFNFILPYSFASIFFILFLSLSLYFFLKFISSEKEGYLILWSIFLSFAFFSRAEMTLPLWLGFVFLGIIFTLKNKDKKHLKWGLYLTSPLIICLLGYCLFLFKNHAFAEFRESFIDIAILEINKGDIFTIKGAGLDKIGYNTFLIFKSLLIHLMLISLLAIGSFAISSFFRGGEKSRFSLFLGILVIFFTFGLAQNYLGNFLQYRCIIIILVIGISIFFIKTIRLSHYKENLSLLTLFLISFLLTLRIFLNTTPHGYGFYLLSLGLICYYIFFLKVIRDLLQVHINYYSDLFHSILIVFFIFLINNYWRISFDTYTYKNLEIKSDMGSIFCWRNNETLRFWETIDYLKNNTSKENTVVVFPEGVSINLFSGRDNPLRYHHFLPPDIKGVGEEKIISQLISSNVDYIIIIHRPTFEYGYPFFGIHYAGKIFSWIKNNYVIIKQFGPLPFTSNEFGTVILKKKS